MILTDLCLPRTEGHISITVNAPFGSIQRVINCISAALGLVLINVCCSGPAISTPTPEAYVRYASSNPCAALFGYKGSATPIPQTPQAIARPHEKELLPSRSSPKTQTAQWAPTMMPPNSPAGSTIHSRVELPYVCINVPLDWQSEASAVNLGILTLLFISFTSYGLRFYDPIVNGSLSKCSPRSPENLT